MMAWLTPVTLRILFWATIVGFITTEYLWVKTHYYNQGWTAAINAIASEDKEASGAADRQRKKVRDCIAGNGEWDTSSGVCHK